MKNNQNSRFAKFLPVLPLLLAAQSFAATTMITFTDARLDRATVSFGTITSVTTTVNGTNNPATISYTVSGLNLDDDGNDTDSVTVTLSLTATGGNPNVQNAGNGRVGVGPGTSEIAIGESISYSFGTITTVTTNGSTVGFTANDFTTLSLMNFAVGEGNTLVSSGGTTFTSDPATATTVIPIPTAGDTSFTFTPTVATTPASNSQGSIISTGFTIAVPEPSSAMLLGSVGLLGLLRRRRNA